MKGVGWGEGYGVWGPRSGAGGPGGGIPPVSKKKENVQKLHDLFI